MILIEYFGLPGSGKSTQSSRLIADLSEKGFRVATYEEFKKSGNGKKQILKGLFTHAGFSFLRKLILSARGTDFFSDEMRVKRAFFCLSFIWYYKTLKGCDFLIMDEGIVQGFISALFDWETKYDFSWLAKILSECGIRPIFVMTDPVISNARLAERNTPEHGRCDRITDEEKRIRILEIQYRRFCSFYEVCREKGLSPIGIDNKNDTTADYMTELLSIKER